jgi:predicted nucleic acid-binding protein
VSALIIDTSVWVSYFDGDGPDSIEHALAESRVHLPPIVAAELSSGRMTPNQRNSLESLLLDLPLCASDLSHWFRVGRLRAELMSKALSVSTPDAHIAQCALDLDAELLTADHIFALIARHQPLRLSAAQK